MIVFLLYIQIVLSLKINFNSLKTSKDHSTQHIDNDLDIKKSIRGSYSRPFNLRYYMTQNNDNNDFDIKKSTRGMKGYYTRPSRAIEKGGGFFVPNLEGNRIRYLSSVVLILLTSVNHIASNTNQNVDQKLITSEFVAIIMAIYLFLQGFLDFIQSSQIQSRGNQQSGLLLLQDASIQDSLLTNHSKNIVKAFVECINDIQYICHITTSDTNEARVIVEYCSDDLSAQSIKASDLQLIVEQFKSLPVNKHTYLKSFNLVNFQGNDGIVFHESSGFWITITNSQILEANMYWIKSILRVPHITRLNQ